MTVPTPSLPGKEKGRREGRRSEQKERRRTIREKKEGNGKETRNEEGGVQKSDGQTNKKTNTPLFRLPADGQRPSPTKVGRVIEELGQYLENVFVSNV